MDAKAILERAGDIGARRVFGDPYERNGVTVIPAARVMGGAGGGDNAGHQAGEHDKGGARSPSGTGLGFGMVGSPAGAFVIKGDEVRWMPALDVNRIALGMQITMIVLLLVVRSVLKARAVKA